MGDARFENFAVDAFDDTRFATMVRKSLHDVVEAALARASGSTEHRQDIRAAGERLGNALVTYAQVPEQPHAAPSPDANERRLASGSESARRTLAFRAMAGVRL